MNDSVNEVSVYIQKGSKELYTYFHNGVIVELPTKWLRFLCKELRYSEATIYQYASNIKSLLTWFALVPSYKTYTLDNILKSCSRKHIQNWIIELKQSGISQRTIRNREASVKEFFEWLITEDGGRVRSQTNYPYKTGKYISSNHIIHRPKYVSEEEVIRLINGYHNESERCLAHFLYDTGLRISEAIRLRLCDLPDENNFPPGIKYYPLRVQGSKGRGRVYRLRTSLITSPLLARLRRYHNTLEYKFSSLQEAVKESEKLVFLSTTGKPLSSRNVRKQMSSAAKRAKLTINYSPHMLRHGAAFSILSSELGKNYLERLVLVQQLFGHSQIKTTEQYTSIPPVLLAEFHSNKIVTDKFEEAKRIYQTTYLSRHKK